MRAFSYALLLLEAINTIGVDLLLAQLLGVSLGVANGVLLQVDLLNRNGFLVHVNLLLVQGDGSFLSVTGDGAVVVLGIFSADRSALNADLFALNRNLNGCLLYTSPSPRDQRGYRMPSSA